MITEDTRLPITEWVEDKNGIILESNPYLTNLYSTLANQNIVGITKHEILSAAHDTNSANKIINNDSLVAQEKERMIFIEESPFGNFLSIKAPLTNNHGAFLGISGTAINLQALNLKTPDKKMAEEMRHQLITPLSVIQQSSWLLSQLAINNQGKTLNENIRAACSILRKNLEKKVLTSTLKSLEEHNNQSTSPLHELRIHLQPTIPSMHIKSTQKNITRVTVNQYLFPRINSFIQYLISKNLDPNQIFIEVTCCSNENLCIIDIHYPFSKEIALIQHQKAFQTNIRPSFNAINASIKQYHQTSKPLLWRIAIPTLLSDPLEPNTQSSQVLLVEDSPLAAIATTSIIEQTLPNATIIHVENGIKALQKIKATCFELIILDINLPDIDGYSIASSIRNHPKSQCHTSKVAFVSAHETNINPKTLSSLNIDGFFEKPLMPTQLHSLFTSA